MKKQPHYGELKIQPTDYIHENNLGFIEGNIIKYVSRYKMKNGKEDLLKALDYLNTLIAKEYGTDEDNWKPNPTPAYFQNDDVEYRDSIGYKK